METFKASFWIEIACVIAVIFSLCDVGFTWTVTSFYETEYRDSGGVYYIKENHQVNLVCLYNSLDAAKLRYLRWNKVDRENPTSPEQIYFSQNSDDVTGSLQGRATSKIQDGSTWINILNFSTSLDATTYQCIVCDTDITCQSSILDINDVRQLELPHVSLIGPEFTLTEGDNFTLWCFVYGGYPVETPSTYSWSFQSIYEDVMTIPGSDKIDSLHEGSKRSLQTHSGGEVSFKSASYYHYGLYQCSAYVTGGISISNSTDVSIYYSPRLVNSTGKKVFNKPIGSSLHLHLAFRSHSRHNISVNWTHISSEAVYTELRYDSLIKLQRSRDTYNTSIEINIIGFADFGVYRCQIDNGLLSTAEAQFQLHIELPSLDQASLKYSKKNSAVILSWNKPKGPYTGVSVLQCHNVPIQCTKHSLTDPYMTTTLTLDVDDKTEYEYYLALYQNRAEVFRSERFSLQEESNDSVFGIIAGLTAAVIIIIVIVVPVCVIKVMECRKRDQTKENVSSKQKMYRWMTRLRKSIKRSKKRKKSVTDLVLHDIEEESESKVQQEENIANSEVKPPPSGKMSSYPAEEPKRELKLIPRSCVLDDIKLRDVTFITSQSAKQSAQTTGPHVNNKGSVHSSDITKLTEEESKPLETSEVKIECSSANLQSIVSDAILRIQENLLGNQGADNEQTSTSDRPGGHVGLPEKPSVDSAFNVAASKVGQMSDMNISSGNITTSRHDQLDISDISPRVTDTSTHSVATQSSSEHSYPYYMKDLSPAFTDDVTKDTYIGLDMHNQDAPKLSQVGHNSRNTVDHVEEYSEDCLTVVQTADIHRQLYVDSDSIKTEESSGQQLHASEQMGNKDTMVDPDLQQNIFEVNAKVTDKLNDTNAADREDVMETDKSDVFQPVEYEV